MTSNDSIRYIALELAAGMRAIADALGLDPESGEIDPVVQRVRELAKERSGVFYLDTQCENCGADVIVGPWATIDKHNELPLIPFDMASQTRFECGECGWTMDTGDFDYVITNDGSADNDESEKG